MTAEADALADVLDTPTYCVGCGRDSRIATLIPCCPDDKYLSVAQLIAAFNTLTDRNVDLMKLNEDLKSQVTRLRLMLDPPKRIDEKLTHAEWLLTGPKRGG